MPRFAVLRHERAGELHWDFFLESGATLTTWALEQPPDAPGPILAVSLPAHRPVYLDYEGPVSGGRGTVIRWDRGQFELTGATETELTAAVSGERLHGAVILRLLESPDRWEFTYAPV